VHGSSCCIKWLSKGQAAAKGVVARSSLKCCCLHFLKKKNWLLWRNY
jgi:hypothetical protein